MYRERKELRFSETLDLIARGCAARQRESERLVAHQLGGEHHWQTRLRAITNQKEGLPARAQEQLADGPPSVSPKDLLRGATTWDRPKEVR